MRTSVLKREAQPPGGTEFSRLLLNLVPKSDLTDGALVARFATQGDEYAFAELVRRLGPMVLGVCRRTLGTGPDADDAFQATFIVLARKAATLRQPGLVGAWLYRVATLAALKAKSQSRRRSMREKTFDPLHEHLTAGLSANPEDEAVIDEELAKLPERYRAPLVLCGIRGMSAKETATELGCPLGTVHSRLSRGRALLARQLALRGVCSCSVATVVSVAMATRVSAEYVAFALRGTTGQASRHVIQLVNAVLHSLAAYKLGMLISAITCGGLLLLGGLAYGKLPPMVADPGHQLSSMPSDDALVRMKLPAMYPWLAQELVLSELACDNTQRDGIRKSMEALREEVRSEHLARMKVLAAQTIESRSIAIRLVSPEASTKFDQSVLPILRTDQLRRLKQLTLHARGIDALLDRHVIRALALTPAQEDQIDALLLPDRLAELDDDSLTAEQFNCRINEGLRVLTAAQRTMWFTLVGREAPGHEIARGLRVGLLEFPQCNILSD